ncbi:MAG: NAD(+)/NADH kinase [Campylobacterales bacterium]|nr:NAD(+)/NADH kinase [Campylobacterales bacterium]
MLNQKLESLKKAGFVLRPDGSIKELWERVKKTFIEHDIEPILFDESAKLVGEQGVDFETLCAEVDFIVALGGDGTLLSSSRKAYKYKKAVLGINAGNLGFLTDISIVNINSFLDALKVGKYRIDERMMMEGMIESKNHKNRTFFALNDIVLTRPNISKMVKIDAAIDEKWFNTYRGDGLVVSTPTGSTAYNLAAGGPVMYPLTKAFIMTPISAHSLTQRPLVVPADFTIELSSGEDDLIVVIDGQDDYKIEQGDILHIRGAKRGARLLHSLESSYFDVLREKLSWGDRR